MENGGTEGAPRGDGPSLKRGSVPPRCTLGSAVLPEFFPEKRLDLTSFKGRTKAEELESPVSELLSFRPPLKAL